MCFSLKFVIDYIFHVFLLMLENILWLKVGMETEGFAIYDAMMQLKNEVLCL